MLLKLAYDLIRLPLLSTGISPYILISPPKLNKTILKLALLQLKYSNTREKQNPLMSEYNKQMQMTIKFSIRCKFNVSLFKSL